MKAFTPRPKQKKALWTQVAGAVPVRSRAKAAKAPKQRKRIKPQSDAQKQRMSRYMPLRDAFLWEHQTCQAKWDGVICGKPADDLHHVNGKAGDLLFYVPYFKSVCRGCHTAIHNNPPDQREAAEAMCGVGRWNRMPSGIVCQDFGVCIPNHTGEIIPKRIIIPIPCRRDPDVSDWLLTEAALDAIEMVKRHQNFLVGNA